MADMPIRIYTQPTCQACQRLKKYLTEKGIAYHERDITTDEQAFADLQKLGLTTTPVIFIGKDMIVGFDQSRLEQLLSQPTL
jgi:glutaredoxin